MIKIEILLVDDDTDDHDFFLEALTVAAIPAKLTTALDSKELIDFLFNIKNQLPDIIFLDINMPVMNGKRCLQEIRKEKKFDVIPIVIYSTSSENRDIEETFAYGANRYIVKSTNFGSQVQILKKMFATGWKESIFISSKEKFLFSIE